MSEIPLPTAISPAPPANRLRAAFTRRRLTHVLLPVVGAIWLLTLAFVLLIPKSYTSETVMILPGAGAGSSLNVESIGQAQQTANSAFATPSLSPTENYKQLLLARVTLHDAAQRVGEKDSAFGEPTIKLVDETNLITVRVTGRTAAKAQAHAEALRAAFFAELDKLRSDEATRREATDYAHLNSLGARMKTAQAKLIAFQAEHGLATLEQFDARIASVDQLRDKERDLRLQLDTQAGTAGRFAGILGDGPGMANALMKLRGDPVFAELAHRYATSNADAETKAATLGPRHGAMAQNEAERGHLLAALEARGHAMTGLSDADIAHAADMDLAEGRSNLMQAMSTSSAQSAGTAAALRDLRGDLAAAKADAPKWITLAQQLADLQRDQRVTEAVFSSALARLESDRQDPYASYPLVQVLAAPNRPALPSTPSLPIALGGAVVASVLAIVGLALAWLRDPLLAGRGADDAPTALTNAELRRMGLAPNNLGLAPRDLSAAGMAWRGVDLPTPLGWGTIPAAADPPPALSRTVRRAAAARDKRPATDPPANAPRARKRSPATNPA